MHEKEKDQKKNLPGDAWRKRQEAADFNKDAGTKELLAYLLPLVAAGFFRQFYSLINTAVVSRCLSVTAVSVIGACGACLSMQSFIATGLTTGFAMYLTRCYGQKEKNLYRQSLTASVLLVGTAFLAMRNLLLRTLEVTAFALPSREHEWKELLQNGGAKSFMMILVGLGNFVMQRAINVLPSEMIAGYAYADNLSNFLMVPISAVATAAMASAGQNMGRSDYERVQLYHRKLMGAHWILSGGAILISFFFGRWLLLLLAGSGASKEVLQAGVQWLYICIPAFLGLGAAMICRNSLQVMGKYGTLIILGLLEMSITILFALFVVPTWGYPAVCLSISAKWMALGVAAAYWYQKRIRELLSGYVQQSH